MYTIKSMEWFFILLHFFVDAKDYLTEHKSYLSATTIQRAPFTSHASSGGYKFGPVCDIVHLSFSALMAEQFQNFYRDSITTGQTGVY